MLKIGIFLCEGLDKRTETVNSPVGVSPHAALRAAIRAMPQAASAAISSEISTL
jgi:hypothetical protein